MSLFMFRKEATGVLFHLDAEHLDSKRKPIEMLLKIDPMLLP
jgi:hypothetical protein